MGCEHFSTTEIEEYYFDDYYRVLVVKDEQGYIVSVDVYRSTWNFDSYESTCIEDVCLLIKRIKDPGFPDVNGLREVVVIGIKIKEKMETINVKWIIDHKPSLSEIESMYKSSWHLISL